MLGVRLKQMWPFKPKRDEFGRSELHYAARDGDRKLAERLIRGGAEVSLADKNGWTPLHFAAQAQSAEVAALLLDAGAQVDPKDVHGNTPLFKAAFESKGSGDTIKLLRARGADPLSENKHGQTPVGVARDSWWFDRRLTKDEIDEYRNTCWRQGRVPVCVSSCTLSARPQHQR